MTTPVYINRPYGLCREQLKKEDVVLLDKELAEIVRFQEHRMTAYATLHDMFKELARNAYLQGVLDCADRAKQLGL
jgi:hypothetical protein